MESFIEREKVEFSKGEKLLRLERKPTDITPNRTVLVRINDPSPRRMEGQIKFVSHLLRTPEEIRTEFDSDIGWADLPNLIQGSDEQTELDIDLKIPGNRDPILLIFRLKHNNFTDTFFHPNGNEDAREAVFRIKDEHSGLCEPQFVDKNVQMLSVIAVHPFNKINYVLGVNVDGEGNAYSTPTLIDPKIENNG